LIECYVAEINQLQKAIRSCWYIQPRQEAKHSQQRPHTKLSSYNQEPQVTP